MLLLLQKILLGGGLISIAVGIVASGAGAMMDKTESLVESFGRPRPKWPSGKVLLVGIALLLSGVGLMALAMVLPHD